MKIIIVSLTFFPAVGGLENVMLGLANEWSKEHDVTVFTKNTDNTKDANLSFMVMRKWNLLHLYQHVKNADVLIEANISLKTSWIGLINKQKWFVIHHTYYGKNNYKSWLKLTLAKKAHNICVSNFLAKELALHAKVIHNFYNPIFKNKPHTQRKGLVFVGRLVSDKGVHILLAALQLLQQKNITPTLSIIGDGPEKINLQDLVNQYKLTTQVFFAGVLKGDDLVNALNEHEVMIIPSIWQEPFGVVALEGLATGCKVVCANVGGLPEAVNEFGFLYEKNNAVALAATIVKALHAQRYNTIAVNNFLEQHSLSNIAKAYIHYFNTTLS